MVYIHSLLIIEKHQYRFGGTTEARGIEEGRERGKHGARHDRPLNRRLNIY